MNIKGLIMIKNKCNICKRKFKNERAYNDHIESNQHKMIFEKIKNKSIELRQPIEYIIEKGLFL